jgi:hypothetical protein
MVAVYLWRMSGSNDDELHTCKNSRLNASSAFCLIPPLVRLNKTTARSTVVMEACWLMSSSIVASWPNVSYPAMRSCRQRLSKKQYHAAKTYFAGLRAIC